MINDIFSTKKILEKPIKKEKIIIDFREKNSLVPAKLKKINLEIELKELKVGDYLVKETIIERKTVNDFASSMINGRLKKQLNEIKQYENFLLIIEGDLNKIKNIHPNSIRGFILSICFHYKVPIIFTQNEEETAKYISIIANKQKKESSVNPIKSNLTIEDQQKFILQSFPGIGVKKSIQLLKEFKNLKKIFLANEKDLEPILGKKSKEFINWLNFPYKN
jgi:ERCC4-type nuclease